MATTRTKKPAAKAPETQPEQEQIVLTGRLTRDPELRHTKSGLPVSTIRIAVNKDGEDTTFHSVVVWNKTAVAVCQYLKRGRLVEVTGRPQQRTYAAADGSERTVDEISAYRVQFVRKSEVAAAVEEQGVAS